MLLTLQEISPAKWGVKFAYKRVGSRCVSAQKWVCGLCWEACLDILVCKCFHLRNSQLLFVALNTSLQHLHPLSLLHFPPSEVPFSVRIFITLFISVKRF